MQELLAFPAALLLQRLSARLPACCHSLPLPTSTPDIRAAALR